MQLSIDTLRQEMQKKIRTFKTVFSSKQEDSLLEYIKTFDVMFHGLTRDDLKFLAFQFAEKNNITHSKVESGR